MQYGTRNMTSRLNIALDESQRKKKEKSHISVYKITNMRVFFNLHSQATTKHDLDVSFFCQLYFGIKRREAKDQTQSLSLRKHKLVI